MRIASPTPTNIFDVSFVAREEPQTLALTVNVSSSFSSPCFSF